jgi:hypothetical protein
VDRFFRIDRPDVDAARFFHREYRLVELNREQKTFQLMAVEPVEGLQGRQPLRLKKTYSFQDEALTVDYELELLTGPSWEGWFSSEVNLDYPAPSLVSGLADGKPDEAHGFTVVDGARKSTQEWEWEPRASVSFDGSRMAPRWWMVLHPGEIWRAKISLTMLRAE